jgi:hypothetical protein
MKIVFISVNFIVMKLYILIISFAFKRAIFHPRSAAYKEYFTGYAVGPYCTTGSIVFTDMIAYRAEPFLRSRQLHILCCANSYEMFWLQYKALLPITVAAESGA